MLVPGAITRFIPMTADIFDAKGKPVLGKVEPYSDPDGFMPKGFVFISNDRGPLLIHPGLFRGLSRDVNFSLPAQVRLVDGVVRIEKINPWTKQVVEGGEIARKPPVILGHTTVAVVMGLIETIGLQNGQCPKCASGSLRNPLSIYHSVLVKTGDEKPPQAWCKGCRLQNSKEITNTLFDGRALLFHSPVRIQPLAVGGYDSQAFKDSPTKTPKAPIDSLIALAEEIYRPTHSCELRKSACHINSPTKAVLVVGKEGGTVLLCHEGLDQALENDPGLARRVILDGRRIIEEALVPIIGNLD